MKTNANDTLPTIEDAIDAVDGDMVVKHDGLADHQTCARCLSTWGAGSDDYAQCGIEIPEDDPGETCPDPNCGGTLGLLARRHSEWPDNVEDE